MPRKMNWIVGLFFGVLGLFALANPLMAAQEWLGLAWWIWLLIILLVIFFLWILIRSGKKDVDVLDEVLAKPEPEFDGKAEAEIRHKDEAASPEDLKRIEGIGPKIADILNAKGITNFSQLAAAEVSTLKQILEDEGLGALSDPTTWPEQAQLAAQGKWEEFQNLQDHLKGGRRE